MIVKNRTLLRSVRYGITLGAVVFSIQARADGGAMPMQLATGQFITPTAPRGAVQQFLNPGLPAYPELHRRRGGALAAQPRRHDAGDALRRARTRSTSRTAPLDTATSTQFIFLYDVSGSHQASRRC